MTDVYRNAFSEVYEIINNLDEYDYNKIPKNVIKAIEKNRNENYEFYLDESLALKDQDVLPETKAILFNFFRDYFANPIQKEKMINFQLSETFRLEEEKKATYNNPNDIFYNQNKEKTNTKQETSLVELKKENFFTKLKNRFKSIFKK